MLLSHSFPPKLVMSFPQFTKSINQSLTSTFLSHPDSNVTPASNISPEIFTNSSLCNHLFSPPSFLFFLLLYPEDVLHSARIPLLINRVFSDRLHSICNLPRLPLPSHSFFLTFPSPSPSIVSDSHTMVGMY